MTFIRTISSPSQSDAELVALYKKEKNLTVLAELFQRYLDMSFALCMKYLKDSDKSKDAVMDVFEQLPAKVLKHDIANFKSWLYVVLKNQCLMQLRSSSNGKVISLDGNFMQSADVTHHDEDAREKEWAEEQLKDCIEGLSGIQKQSITLFYLEDKCYKEISTITGWDFNKVRSLIQNGKRNLRICMDTKAGKTVRNE